MGRSFIRGNWETGRIRGQCTPAGIPVHIRGRAFSGVSRVGTYGDETADAVGGGAYWP